MTRELDNTPLDLVIWPEAALPMFEDQARPVLERAQAGLPDETQLLTGILQRDEEGNFYNSVVGLNGVQGEYRKRTWFPSANICHWRACCAAPLPSSICRCRQ